MSYTMTLDVPQKTAAYVGARHQLRKELNAVVIAIVAAKMRCEEADDGVAETPGPSLLDAIREADEIADGRREVVQVCRRTGSGLSRMREAAKLAQERTPPCLENKDRSISLIWKNCAISLTFGALA